VTGPPQILKIGQVPKYLMTRYQFAVSRQSVYNWISKGLKHEYLQFTYVKSHPTAKHPTIRVTTARWVDEFLRRSGIELRPPRSEEGGPAASAGDLEGQSPLGPALEP
jgi:hypothetical protein